MKLQPMLQVHDVEAASAWYQRVLGLQSGHGGAEYEMLFAGEPHATPMLLQLHRWDAHEHGFLGSPDQVLGNGCSFFFEVPDRPAFDAVWGRISEKVLKEPHWNPLAHHWEFAVNDLNGYVVVVATPFEMNGGPA